MVGRRITLLEVNRFIAGLITDANPLTFPKDASSDEENFILNIDGSRQRRLGLDFEDSAQQITTTISTAEPGFSSYKWDNAGGDPAKSLLVIQIGNEIKVFDLDITPISSGLIYTFLFSAADPTVNFGYATIDGTLVVVTGQKQPQTFVFAAPSTVTTSSQTLLVRDLFGVEDFISVDLYDNIGVRPSSTTNAHTYNLRNSTWAISRPQGSTEAVDDPITYFFANSSSLYPSNSDTVNYALYPDATDTGGPTLKRFFAVDLVKNPRGSIAAPKGYFIIDALARGPSRLAQEAANRALYSLDFSVSSLPTDTTPGGASCIAEFAGRAWYGGFSGQLTSGDKNSPHMSSYLLFSKLVKTPNDVIKCYQEADPTSDDQSDLVATDGGFVRINEAFGIQAIINVGTSLIIMAKNGVWRLYGGNNYGFDPTNYVVERITDHGIVSLNSLIVVDNTVMFWGEDGIYHIHPNDSGMWVSDNITFGSNQTLYESIPISDKQKAKGAFDSFERKVRWVYYNRLSDTTETKELVLDINLKAYYQNAIKQFTGTALPRLLTPFKVNPYTITLTTTPIVVATVQVQDSAVDVVQTIPNVLGNAIKEIGYLVVTQLSPVIKYTFAFYRNANFRDWFSQDSVGVDAAAYVITGYYSDAPSVNSYTVTKYDNFTRYKQVPYIHVHCRRTETGFEEDINGDLQPLNPSSCIMQAMWEWSNSVNSKRWGNANQVYRYKRLYMPVDANDPFDTGFATIVTKNKLRGKGKVLSLKFSTEPYKDLHLYGWSLDISVADTV